MAPAPAVGLHVAMRTLLSTASVILVAAAAAACGDDAGGEPGVDGAVPDATASVDAAQAADAGADAGPDDWTPAEAVLGNSGARFRVGGVTLGGGVAARTIVPLATRGDAGPLAIVGSAVAVRGATTDLFAEIRNTGDAVRCFVELADLETRNAGGELVGSGSGTFAFVAGSIRETAGEVTTDACLGPGETAWAVYTTALAAGETLQVASATVVVRSQAGAFATPPAELVPSRQQLRAAGLAVELVNRGQAAAVFGGARWIGFDAAGLPVGWTWLMVDSAEPEAPIAAGGKVVATPYPRPLDASAASPVHGVVASSIVRVDYKSE
jgi:hypothetical protein